MPPTDQSTPPPEGTPDSPVGAPRTVAEFLADVRADLAEGRSAREPRTFAELEALAEELPEVADRFRPSDRDRRGMGLPPGFGRPATPFRGWLGRRIVATVDAGGWGR